MSYTLKMRFYGDPCLRKKSQPLARVGAEERMLILAMIETMHEQKGIGLAAPQVGINQQIFVADTGDGPFVVVNPKIIEKSGESVLEEGCLSIPGVMLPVKRPERIVAEYIDLDNKKVTRELTALAARVFQHETDHLFGRLIVDYADLENNKDIKDKLQALANKKSEP